MKKSIVLMALSLLLGTGAFANDTYIITDLNMDNFWAKTGKAQEKVTSVATRIMEQNKLNKRVPVFVVSKNNEANAVTNPMSKIIEVYSGLLTCIDNDDELAFILGHEMAHAVEAYQGPWSIFYTFYNSKSYEYKSDLKSIDYMVTAGYDPISAIIIGNKIFGEPYWDWGSTHPKGSKRLLAMYKYIYKKYPQYFNSPKTNSAYYKNFEYTFAEELKGFRHKESVRQQKQLKKEAI
ncbi:MAG: M48 family metalloprotease [Fusobacterium sp.]|nr:M48 family metalloprotease [Fusobacterium sp.]